MHRNAFPLVLVLFVTSAAGCPRSPGTTPAANLPNVPGLAGDGKVEAAGLHNVYQLSEKLYSGSSPDGEEGFRSLEKLGVKTVISVDGARPDLEVAHKYGMRYVHIPIGYDGFTQEQALRLSKAARDLPGPVYFHCHHGKHRGPTAAAVALLALDERCTVEAALADMRRAGTDPHYTGLYAMPAAFRRPSAKELDALAADFPEETPAMGLVPFMVGIDERLDRLKAVRAAGWKAPSDHPDLDPPHEALQLAEQFREAGRLPEVQERSEAFRRLLSQAEGAAMKLEAALRGGPEKVAIGGSAAERAFAQLHAGCAECHAKYRDPPKYPPLVEALAVSPSRKREPGRRRRRLDLFTVREGYGRDADGEFLWLAPPNAIVRECGLSTGEALLQFSTS